jgi:hypothetical protein
MIGRGSGHSMPTTGLPLTEAAVLLGQYWANISDPSRLHGALPGRVLEFGWRFFRSLVVRLGGFDSLPRHLISV